MESRTEIERILLAEVVDRRSLDFLVKEGITPDYFGPYEVVATRFWGESEIPSRRIVESWDKCAIKDWEPEPEGVPYAIQEIRDIHAHDNFNVMLLGLKDRLRSNEDG